MRNSKWKVGFVDNGGVKRLLPHPFHDQFPGAAGLSCLSFPCRYVSRPGCFIDPFPLYQTLAATDWSVFIKDRLRFPQSQGFAGSSTQGSLSSSYLNLDLT